MKHRTRLWLAAAVAGVVAILAGILIGPQHQVVGKQTAGDAELAARARAAVDGVGGRRSLAVAEVTSTSLTWAGLGNSHAGRSGPPPTEDSVFQAGSVAKTLGRLKEALENDRRLNDARKQAVEQRRGQLVNEMTELAQA